MESDYIGLQSTRIGPRIDIHGIANGGVAKSFLFAHSFAYSFINSFTYSPAVRNGSYPRPKAQKTRILGHLS